MSQALYAQTETAMSDDTINFTLTDEFLADYEGKQPEWGPLGYVTYKRTYARSLPDGGTEEYWQTVKRCIEGTFTIQKRHCIKNQLPWSEEQAQIDSKEMYKLMWEFKFTPPGRGLWMMGTDYVYTRGGACLNNCAFVSTKDLAIDFAEPFVFLMDMSMLGVGVGGDAKGAGTVTIQQPLQGDRPYIVEDTREGWVELIRTVLNAYVGRNPLPNAVDYSKVRPFGERINGFGGVASGPEPLAELYENIQKLFNKRIGETITSSDIVDIFNLIGRCVVAGNVRRTAEIMFGEPDDQEFLDLKNPEMHKEELMHHRWASNNSIFANVGMDYTDVADRTARNGEPGYEWLDNAQKYGRMIDPINNKDARALGGNPCLEQTLEPYELCCLVETYPSMHNSPEEWIKTLRYAFMYAKSVTLVMTHNTNTNKVMARNRRIGTSMTGIVQAFKKFGRRTMLDAANTGYEKIQEWDTEFSERFAVPKSVKTTSVKPSGTVSLLPGVTPGIHYPIAEYYIRNIRFQEGSPLIDLLKSAGYPIEKDKYSPKTFVVSFPIKERHFDRSVQDVSMWEQLENAAQIQAYWADNQVSVTISFDKNEASEIKHALELYESRLKGVSLLPKMDHGYEQAPYIPISKEEYEELAAKVQPVIKALGATHEVTDKFCDGEACEIQPGK